MPILPVTNPAISIVPADFSSLLPPSITGGNALPLFRALTAASFGQNHMDNGVRLAAHLGRNLATTIGWEALEIPRLSTLSQQALAVLPTDAIASMFDSLKVTASALQLLKPVTDAIEAAISGVPILGWIARIGFATWAIVRDARNAEVPAEGVALGYDREQDTYIANEMLRTITGADWTELFEPPAGAFSWETIAYTSRGVADGVAWGQLDGDLTWGMVPGVGSIAGYWQSPRNAPGSSRFADRAQIIGMENLLPSTTALSGQIWTDMQRPTPALGRVDFKGLRDRWHTYGDALRAFAGREPDTQRGRWFRDQILAAWSWRNRSGGVFYDQAAGVPKNYGDGLDALASWKCDTAWSHAVQSMQTHAAAYLTSSTPLVRNDVQLRTLLDKHRRELVEDRPDVVDVDVTLVPDVGYRNAIIAAQNRVKGAQAGESKTEKRRRLLEQHRQAAKAPDLPSLPGESGSGGLLLLAGGALLLWLAHRRASR